MAFEIGDAGIKIPGLERTMASGTCSDVNDVMKVCQRELGPLFEVSARRGRSRRMKAGPIGRALMATRYQLFSVIPV